MSTQGTLDGQLDVLLTVETDYGEIATSASRPHKVKASDGLTYVIKKDGVSRCRDGSMRMMRVMSQEVLRAILGARVGLPVAEWSLIDHDEVVWYGSRFYETPMGPFNSARLMRLHNFSDVHILVCFDVWMGHTDRNYGNVIFARRANRDSLVAIDHGFCPVFECNPVDSINSKRGYNAFQCCHPFRFDRLLFDVGAWNESIRIIQSVTDDEIEAAIHWNHHSRWTNGEKRTISSFIRHRRDRLVDFFRACSDEINVQGAHP